FDRIPFGAHFHRLGHSCKSRETMGPSRAWNKTDLSLGLADQGPGSGHAIVPRHRKLQTAAERSSMNRHHKRFPAVFDLEQERQQSRTARACAGRELSEFP